MLCVLASSPLSWTGKDAFHLVGYSLGGGISINFNRYYSDMIKSLILLAPAGLVRPESFGTATRFVFSSGFVPERILTFLTKRRLQRPIAASRMKENATRVADEMVAASKQDWNKRPLHSKVLAYARWMVIHHPGFIPAFMSCIIHAPMVDQHDSWRHISKREAGSTMFLFAKNDELIEFGHNTRVGLPLVGGEGNVVWKGIANCSHDFVMTHPEEIMTEIDDFLASQP